MFSVKVFVLDPKLMQRQQRQGYKAQSQSNRAMHSAPTTASSTTTCLLHMLSPRTQVTAEQLEALVLIHCVVPHVLLNLTATK